MQGFFKILIFGFISFGIFRLFNLKKEFIISDVVRLFSPREESIKNRILIAKGKKKRNKFFQLIYDTREILNLLNRQSEFPLVCFSSVVLGVAALTFCIINGNLFLIIPLCTIAFVAPFIYMRHRGIKLKKMINEELETALSIISNSYIRNENILLAVEENIEYIHMPIKNIFKAFVFNCDYLSSDIKQNLRKLKNSLNNSIFQEWCNALISCQEDSSLRYTLTAIVKKLSYVRIVSVKLDSILYEPVREFVFMVIILFFNIPVFFVLNRQWFHILMNTGYGHITIAIVVGIVAFCTANVIRLTKPVEYQR